MVLGKAASFKKAIYLISSTILGVFLAYLAHAAIEINYLSVRKGEGCSINKKRKTW